MKFEVGFGISQLSGSLGGSTASKNAGGSYFRNKTTPTNPQTVAQQSVRSLFGDNSSAWKSLSQAARDGWNSATKNFPMKDVFGKQLILSGLQLFSRLNMNLLNSGGTALSFVAPNAGVKTVSLAALTYTSGAPSLIFTTSGAIPAGTRAIVRATPPMSQGINFVKSEYRIISTLAPAAASPFDIESEYVAKFGALGAVGTKIFVSIQFVDQTSGLSSAEQVLSKISTV